MNLDYTTLDTLRRQHPAWRLLTAEHAVLVASFLHHVFIAPNVRVMAQADLAEALEDTLFGLRERLGAPAFPKSAQDYLNDWAANDKGWLRKFYPTGSDEPHLLRLRLEQERIGFGWLQQALAQLEVSSVRPLLDAGESTAFPLPLPLAGEGWGEGALN